MKSYDSSPTKYDRAPYLKSSNRETAEIGSFNLNFRILMTDMARLTNHKI